jgi:DNA-binding response OmpR family regulator
MHTVLVADDDVDIRALVTFRLHQAGYCVLEAPDGPTALAIARSDRPDAAVLDVSMPGATGIEVCQQLRADPAVAELPVLLLSAAATEREIEAGLAAGADDYLTKPFHARELLARVDAMIRQAGTAGGARSAALLATTAARAAYGSSRSRIQPEILTDLDDAI